MNFKQEDGNSVCTCSRVLGVNIVSYKKLNRERKQVEITGHTKSTLTKLLL